MLPSASFHNVFDASEPRARASGRGRCLLDGPPIDMEKVGAVRKAGAAHLDVGVHAARDGRRVLREDGDRAVALGLHGALAIGKRPPRHIGAGFRRHSG